MAEPERPKVPLPGDLVKDAQVIVAFLCAMRDGKSGPEPVARVFDRFTRLMSFMAEVAAAAIVVQDKVDAQKAKEN